MKRVDATQGNLFKLIFAYSIPMILATIAQTLFTIADKAVLGNMAGSVAVASIGATGTVSSLIINGAVGLSSGTSIVVARFWGQKDEEKVRTTIDTALITAVGIGLLVAIAGVSLAPTFLTLTNCPAACYDGAVIYMRIYIAAAPFTLLYNYGAAILRALGDTRRPLNYILVAGVANVVLNVILCLILPQKVAAVAIATAVSKIISSLLVLRRLCRMEDFTRVVLHKVRFCGESFRRILRFGIPISISNLVIPLSGLQITPAINSYGFHATAGNSAAASIEGIVTAFAGGFNSATANFMAQNIGAKNIDRVRKSFRYTFFLNLFITGTLGVVVYLTGRIWLRFILGADAAEAVEFGMVRMFYVCLFMAIASINYSTGGAMNAFGYTSLSSISNIVFTLGFRVFWMLCIYPLNPTFDTLMLCFTASWITKGLAYIAFLAVVYTRYVKTGICKKM